MERRRTVILSWLVLAFSSAMSSSSVTPSTLASSSSPSVMSYPSGTPRTLASSSSLSSPSSPSVTPATKPPECTNYRVLNDPSVSATYRLDGLWVDPCTDRFKPGWHRFGGEAGNQMADTCVKMCHCGARYPGWLTGGHPSVEDGAVVRKVCFVGHRGCCDSFVYISIRNCSGFYVYNLTSIPSSSCYYGYCASTGYEEPTSSTTEFSKQRFLNGTDGIISVSIYYYECMYPHYSWQIEARKGEKVKLEIQSMYVSSWNGSCTLRYLEIQNGTYADGKPSSRMCGIFLSGIATFYSHEGQSLELVVANMDPYWSWMYFTATYTVISYNDTVSNECSNYGFLNESNRAMTHVNSSIGNLCDSTLSGWYRFSGEAGTQMADSCRKMYHCNTFSPGWLDGAHPTVAEEIVQRKVCFSQHFNGTDCCYFSKEISVRNCGAFYVYRLDPPRCYSRYCGNGLPQAPECSNYKLLNDSSISAAYRLDGLSGYSCKDYFKPGWHRFGGEAGNQMADTCVKMCHCGARYPGWLTGGHPSVEDGAVVRKVCFVVNNRCCDRFVYISVRNCSGFYVYNLTSIPSSSCNYGYCVSTGIEEPTTSRTEFSKQRLLTGTDGIISVSSYYYSCMYPHYSWQIEAKKGEKVKLVIQSMYISWWNGPCTLGYLEIQNGTYADGKPSSRMCGNLLSGIVTFYSHEGQSLEVVLAIMNSYWSWVSFTATYTVISYNDTVSNECSNYGFLNESNRAMTFVNRSIGNLCDSTLSGWYRFSGEAGTQMADSCRKMYHCNTDSPGWLNGTHPTVAEGIVQRKVCFLQHLNGTDCCYLSKDISVRNCGAFYVYRLDPPRCNSRYCGNGLPQAPECSNYKFVNDSSVSAAYRLDGLSGYSCKDYFKPGWHRFGGEAGNQMADTCVKMCHCGARYPGWLTGGHPSVEDGAVLRKVCFVGNNRCCDSFVYISVRNCSGFYVYNLTSIPSSHCAYGYCASTGLEEPTTSTTGFSKQRLLNGTDGIISVSSYYYYYSCMYPHYSWQIEAKKGEKVKLVIQSMYISWWNGPCTLGYLEIQNGTYADGKPSSRMCGNLLSGIVTFYSHEGQSLEVVLAIMNSYWSWVSFTATYTVISYNDTVSNDCSNYKFLNESNRAMTYVNSSIGNLCDSTLSGWYRFSGEAGTQMADSCPKIHHCSTDSPGWLNGTHPTVAEGIVQRKVCFSQHLNGTDCCYFSKDISVRNCGAFYVYRLDPPRCNSRYCGNGLPQAPECSNYKSLTEGNRATTYPHNHFQLFRCINEGTLSGWYRFDREGGNQMADTCVEMYHCGAVYPGWLSGGHPSVKDGAVVRRVCFNRYYGCCEYFVYISVRNCGGFYVYKLTPLPTSSYCYYRYCASNGTALVLPTTLTTGKY
ncbi:uncharacterized protein [Montipora capricornis]|uniref:uncharacterized protein n=1 Tax=Montipora capricornis TaxID=246305 RepID=UPI0035F1CC78